MKILLTSILFPMTTVNALSASSLSIPLPKPPSLSSSTGPSGGGITDDIVVTSAPWRITLDIGREPLANMPFKWARSGCRMPLVIPCDIQSDKKIVPQGDTVSFTGPDGAVISPIVGGNWDRSNNRELTMDFTFPQYMERRDVWIDAGTTLTLSGIVYTKDELDKLDREFYDARDEAWELGGQLNDIAQLIDGPKQWNEELQKWEKRTDGIPSILRQMQLRAKHLAAQTKQKQKSNQRPRPNDLSEGGSFPGSTSNVFVQKQGVIKIGNVIAG
eukprot:CAMPEP_0195303070 /NCGR_PEP_ID=MMETSP0707-20130614/32193_1 /TAXON_ID=33640 /ORGANISM="Asterionellopsis glacialis, Strain CCMP134" /LENGTH=272 /DNA_ID=CAMNT_0040366509 /DNA_START=64 /DNA_END=879 /DNA_ORIENTATION=-